MSKANSICYNATESQNYTDTKGRTRVKKKNPKYPRHLSAKLRESLNLQMHKNPQSIYERKSLLQEKTSRDFDEFNLSKSTRFGAKISNEN